MKKILNRDEDTLITAILLSLEQEKRTSLKAIRIGISLVAVQASFLFLLLAASSYYTRIKAMHGVILFWTLNMLIFGMAVFVITRLLVCLHRLNQKELKLRLK